jgi:exonuclease VII large subunit
VPNRRDVVLSLHQAKQRLDQTIQAQIRLAKLELRQIGLDLNRPLEQLIKQERSKLISQNQLLNLLSPEAALQRGYAIVRKNHKVVRSKKDIHAGDIVEVQLLDADVEASIKQIKDRQGKSNG